MAELLLAKAERSHGFAKVVVLKRIHPHLADDPGFVEMFLDEARLAAQLDHPNVVQVFDIGEAEDGTFFTMEYLRGADVRELLSAVDGALPLEHAIAITVGVAAGLHHAHTKVGIDGRPLAVIHRDVSPTNVIVTYEGAVKVVDFGIAKATTNQRHTRQSRLKGKIAYMSPEQCAGATLDARSDVFSLGTMLYEITTGVRPFEGDSEFVTMNAIVNADVVPPSQHVDGYPAGLEAVVLQAMAREPEARFETAEAFRRELEAFARGAGIVLGGSGLGDFVRAQVPEVAEDTDPGELPAAEVSTRAETAPTVSVSPGREATELEGGGRSWVWGVAVAAVVGVGVAGWRLAGSEVEAEPVADVPAVGQPAVESKAVEPEPEPESEPEPEPEPEPEVVIEPEPEPSADPEPEPAVVPRPRKKTKRREDKKVDGDAWVPIRKESP